MSYRPTECSSLPAAPSGRTDTVDQAIYIGCWVLLVLYVLFTLVAFARRNILSCAVAFLFACFLWLGLALFNAWFLLPAFIYHIREINLHIDSLASIFPGIFISNSAQDVYLIMLGSVGSSVGVLNAASMLNTEDLIGTNLHEHGRPAKYAIKISYQICEYLGFTSDGAYKLPTTSPRNENPDEKRPFLPEPVMDPRTDITA
ncbi:hypothetical protein F4777DRAFT_577358 [Nemania sp. FL0916]|nr:hypothetical protein F4777DRAFT_577358 [Nemania sp. FL0916]